MTDYEIAVVDACNMLIDELIDFYICKGNTGQQEGIFVIAGYKSTIRVRHDCTKFEIHPDEQEMHDNSDAVALAKKILVIENYIIPYDLYRWGICRSCVVETDTPRDPDGNKNIFVVVQP